MILKILSLDNQIEEIYITRVFMHGEYLYYETCNHLHGKGVSIPVSDIKCWEVNAIIHGGNIEL